MNPSTAWRTAPGSNAGSTTVTCRFGDFGVCCCAFAFAGSSRVSADSSVTVLCVSGLPWDASALAPTTVDHGCTAMNVIRPPLAPTGAGGGGAAAAGATAPGSSAFTRAANRRARIVRNLWRGAYSHGSSSTTSTWRGTSHARIHRFPRSRARTRAPSAAASTAFAPAPPGSSGHTTATTPSTRSLPNTTAQCTPVGGPAPASPPT